MNIDAYPTLFLESIEETAQEFVATLEVDPDRERRVSLAKVYGRSCEGTKVGIPFDHWAIVVGGKFLYYLTFDYRGKSKSIPDRPFADGDEKVRKVPQGIRFSRDLMESVTRTEVEIDIGYTFFGHEDIQAIGAYLADKFGPYVLLFESRAILTARHRYYRVFANSGHYVCMLLRLLTGENPPVTFCDVRGVLFRLPNKAANRSKY